MKKSLIVICFSTALLITSFEIVHAQEFTNIQLDPPSNNFYNFSSATAINNAGVVIGNGSAMYTTDIICIWKPGQPYPDQHYFHGYNRTTAEGINDKGNLVGYGPAADGIHGFLNSTDLGKGRALDINDRDQVVGWTSDSLYIYENGVFDYLPTSYWGSAAVAINDSGIAVGYWITDCDNSDCYEEACIFRNDSLILIGRLGGNYARASDINNRGQIVGWSCTNSDCSQYRGFIWNNGVWTTIPTLGGSGSEANAINDYGIVVGEAKTASNAQHAIIYDSSHGLRDLNDLIPQGGGWELISATDINDAGQIVGVGRINGLTRAFLLTPTDPGQITITKPSEGSLIIAGEKDTIKWEINGVVDSVRIKVILNWHLILPTEILIAESVPAYDKQFEWNIPDTLLSYKTKIKIEDKNDPTNFAESESFRLKGYVLTRVNTIDLTYQKFDRTTHAWRFGNATNNMWPSTWWFQFTYDQTTIDPYSNDFYSEDFNGVHQSFFPDWLAFVRAFGANQCYWSVPLLGLTYRQNAINNWKSRWGVWGGSCFGFATSSLMAFTDVNTYVATYPEMPPFNNLYQFSTPLSGIQGDSIRAIINSLQIHQSGKQHQTFIGNLGNDTPLQTLNKIKSSIIEDNGDIGPLLIYNQGTGGGAHAIVVYELIKSTLFANSYTLFVYDNSYPANLFAQITIDTVANRWNAPLWAGWGGTNGILIADPINSYFNQPILRNGPLDNSQLDKSLTGNTLNENTKSEVYVSRNLDIVLSDTLGNSIGFKDSVIFNTIPNAYPILFAETYYTPPSGYHIPAGKYKIDISAIHDSLVNFYFFGDSVTYLYRRIDASPNQTDHLHFDSGLSIASYDPGIKSIELETTIANSEYEKVFQLRDIKLSASDSIEIKENANDGITVKNFGVPKSYGLKVKYNSNEFIKLFKHEGVTLAQNSSHVFQPVWASLDTMSFRILIDNGNDEVIDDSIFVVNQATGIGDDQGSLLSPNIYNLAQNYPNPFNPTTKISWQSPVGSWQTLKVYDVLGNEVAKLVDEYKPAGNYEIIFDAKNLSSGVYFYKLQISSFVETKKMILLR